MFSSADRSPGLPDGLLAALRTQIDATGGELDVHRRGLAAWQLRRVTEHMRANLDRPVALAELAALVRLSRFHFCTAFRLATGQTPRNWLIDERIRRAAALLADPSLTITEIALEVGYDTPSAFTARFRQRMNMTPSEYRRMC